MERDLLAIGRALSTPARAAMVGLMFDGQAHPAGELCATAGVATATGSQHLAVLVDSGLVGVTRRGRFKYFRILDADTAFALESLGRSGLPAVTSLRLSAEQRRLRAARTCYDHLAGQLGVALTEMLRRRAWLSDDLSSVTSVGRLEFLRWSIVVEDLEAGRRAVVRSCVDWTERRPHLAGALGAALSSLALSEGWVRRVVNGRGLMVTPIGRSALAELDVTLPEHSDNTGQR